MSARRRRERRADPLASVAAVRRTLGRVRAGLPAGVEIAESDLIRALRAASHCERTGWKQSRRGRRPSFAHATLRAVWDSLERALRQERASGVSGRTFAENYLRLLDCPDDVLEPLGRGRINLFEALQLARIRAETGDFTGREASELRARVLAAHLAERASARQLSERVDSLLGRGPALAAEQPRAAEDESVPEPADTSLDDFLADPGALFADQLRQVTAALSQVDPRALSDGEIDGILDLLDQLYLRALRASRKPAPS